MTMTSLHWNHSSHNDHKLVNFNIPKYLLNNFDNLNRFKRNSRTQTMISLIENYIRSEHKLMKEDDTLNLMITDVQKRNRDSLKRDFKKDSMEVKEEFEPPMIPLTSDDIDWEDRLNGLG